MNTSMGKLGFGLAAAVAAVGVVSVGVRTTQAEISLTNNGVPVNPTIAQVGGTGAYANDYIWTYTLTVDTGSGVSAGDQLAFVDFLGYDANAQASLIGSAGLGTGATVGDWALTTANEIVGNNLAFTNNAVTGLQDTNPSGLAYDSPNIPDLILTYTGTTGVGVAGPSGVALGTFSFVTSVGSYSSQGHLGYSISTATGSPVKYTSGQINGNDLIDTPAVPLPAAFWPGLMTLGGMAVVGGLRLRRRAL